MILAVSDSSAKKLKKISLHPIKVWTRKFQTDCIAKTVQNVNVPHSVSKRKELHKLVLRVQKMRMVEDKEWVITVLRGFLRVAKPPYQVGDWKR